MYSTPTHPRTYFVCVVLLHERRHLVAAVAAAHADQLPLSPARRHDVVGDGGRARVGELRAARRVGRNCRRRRGGQGRAGLQVAAAGGRVRFLGTRRNQAPSSLYASTGLFA